MQGLVFFERPGSREEQVDICRTKHSVPESPLQPALAPQVGSECTNPSAACCVPQLLTMQDTFLHFLCCALFSLCTVPLSPLSHIGMVCRRRPKSAGDAFTSFVLRRFLVAPSSRDRILTAAVAICFLRRPYSHPPSSYMCRTGENKTRNGEKQKVSNHNNGRGNFMPCVSGETLKPQYHERRTDAGNSLGRRLWRHC